MAAMPTETAHNPPGLVPIACLLPLTGLASTLYLLAVHGLPLQGVWPWVPALGLELRFLVDGLSALMLLMISGIGCAVFVYAGGYLKGDPGLPRLYLLLGAFMLAMIGCVTADNLILLFLCWEATSLLSFLLVGYHHERAESRKSAQQALFVTGGGGLLLLAGFLLLGSALGSYTISEILPRLAQRAPDPLLLSALGLILAGAFTKSAQFPFHFWLPNAMAAPTPVSAYLHSATMVKLGVFLLARLDPGFGHWAVWIFLLQAVGAFTAAWAMVLAIRERDLKRILAWSTVATLGTLTALVGLPGEGAAIATGALLLAHALYKAPLFFVAGNIDHGTGTRIIDRLGRLRHAMPWTATAALLAGISMAGLPLSFGYVVKSAIAVAKTGDEVLPWVPLANALFSAIAVGVAGVAALRVFWWHPGQSVTPPAHECSLSMIAPPLVLALLGLLFGLFPVVVQPLVAHASVAMTAGSDPIALEFAAPHSLEIGAVLAASGLTLLLGGAIYLGWDPLHRAFSRAAADLPRMGATVQYERLLAALPRLAARTTRALQHGRLPGYLTLFLVVTSATVGLLLIAPLSSAQPANWLPAPGPFNLTILAATAVVLGGAVAACRVQDRLQLLLAAGLVGYGSALIFLFAGAPDVALTQFTVETVFVLVVAGILIALRRQGRGLSLAEPVGRPWALLLALALAAVLTLALAIVLAQPFDPALSVFFSEQSLPAAQGRNVVNVILVDFRALDTLGEISVVLVSLLAALPLLATRRGAAR